MVEKKLVKDGQSLVDFNKKEEKPKLNKRGKGAGAAEALKDLEPEDKFDTDEHGKYFNLVFNEKIFKFYIPSQHVGEYLVRFAAQADGRQGTDSFKKMLKPLFKHQYEDFLTEWADITDKHMDKWTAYEADTTGELEEPISFEDLDKNVFEAFNIAMEEVLKSDPKE